MKKETLKVEFSDDDGETGGFNINADFARKYDHNARRNEKERLQDKYGKDESKWDQDGEGSESESDYGSEDSDANMLTEKAETKFKDLIHRIQTKDMTLFTETEGEYFKDADFVKEEDENAT